MGSFIIAEREPEKPVCVCGGAPRPPRSPAVAVTGNLSFRRFRFQKSPREVPTLRFENGRFYGGPWVHGPNFWNRHMSDLGVIEFSRFGGSDLGLIEFLNFSGLDLDVIGFSNFGGPDLDVIEFSDCRCSCPDAIEFSSIPFEFF